MLRKTKENAVRSAVMAATLAAGVGLFATPAWADTWLYGYYSNSFACSVNGVGAIARGLATSYHCTYEPRAAAIGLWLTN